MLSLVTALSFSAVSCGGDDDDSSSSDKGGGDNTPASYMTPTQQKQYLEKVGLEFMAITKSQDFKGYADFGKYVKDTYKNYNWDNVGDWAKRCFDEAVQLTGHREDNDRNDYQYYSYIYNYFYNDYVGTLLASQFTGHFTASNGRWTRTDASDLQFIFNDQNGSQCVLKLATSGKVTYIHSPKIKEKDRKYYSDYIDNKYVYTTDYTYDTYDLTIGVPEQIEVTLTQGGAQLVKTTVKFDISNMQGNEFVLSNSNLTVGVVINLSNGYEFNVSQVAYKANESAAVNFAMSKSGSTLLSLAVASNVSGLPSYTFSNVDNARSKDFSNVNGTNAVAKIDVLGKVQIQGTVSDIRKLSDYIEMSEEYRYDEAQYKSYINQANSLIDLNVYYDNNSTKQATIKLEAFAKQSSWSSQVKWKAEPIMLFYDGSSYSTLSAFFNENDFNQSVNTFKSLVQSFADLVGERVRW